MWLVARLGGRPLLSGPTISKRYTTLRDATDHDWGVVKFAKPISSSWFGIKPSDTSSAFSGQKATVTGFPGEKGTSLIRDYGQLWTMSGILQPRTQTRLCYNLDTTGGQSGSPVDTTKILLSAFTRTASVSLAVLKTVPYVSAQTC